MKVLMIAPQPFFEPRGTPISVYQRLQALSRLGHQVDLATYPIGKDVSIDGVRLCRAPAIPFIREVSIGPSWRKLVLDSVLFFKALWLLSTRRYDLIHTHEEAAFFALILAPLFRTPHLYDMHSSLPRQLAAFRPGKWRLAVRLFTALEQQVLRTASLVLTIGHDLEAYVLARNPHANHLRLENTAIQADTPLGGGASELKERLGLNRRLPIVYSGTFEHYQGLGLLLESLQRVVAQRPDVALVLVGGKPAQVRHWQAEASRLGLAGHVWFAGMVSPAESLRYLELAEILVSPRTAGLSIPLKIYSYLSAGKPTVATRIEAHTQILTDETAVLVEATPAAYAAGMMRLIEQPELRGRMGRQARAFAEARFSTEGYLAQLKAAYAAVRPSQPVVDGPPAVDSGEGTLSLQ